MATVEKGELLTLTAQIVVAYISKNPVPPAEMPQLIASVCQTLEALAVQQEIPELVPAVSVEVSVRSGAIVCLECGKDHRILKGHLRAAHRLSAEEYRQKWQLPFGYPLVAPDYTAQRRKLAKEIGLGKQARGKKGKRA